MQQPSEAPGSGNTSSDEVFHLAQRWMSACTCANFWEEPGAKWYPRRLLDLNELRCVKGNKGRAKVRVVESSTFLQETRVIGTTTVYTNPNYRYVTLSHCWGKQQPLKLTSTNMARFMNSGIELRELPNTFRDALLFACRLEHVRFVWIDSLCIRQPRKGPEYEEKEELRDWVEQSREMDRVYRKAYLNVSATASVDGQGGLFRDRNPKQLQEDVIDVYYPNGTSKPTADDFTRCTVVNASAWKELVTQAPINRRGWVLQERLLAPRVLHFGHNQVAWECAEFDGAENFPTAFSTFQSTLSAVASYNRAKDFRVVAGRRSRDARLNGLLDPDSGMPDLYVFELWKKVVEDYSTTQLSVPSDVLMALAGIARHFQEHIFSPVTKPGYLAGMWSMHLESQLLWHVNENYTGKSFDNPSKRFPRRAPSFSWAAIETPYGITYGETTDFGIKQAAHTVIVGKSHDSACVRERTDAQLLFKVVDYSITLVDAQNSFGMIQGGQMLLQPRHLLGIDLIPLPEKRKIAYSWSLKPHPTQQARSRMVFDLNYFDAPVSDTDVFEKNAELYVMLGAYSERTTEANDRGLCCLLLKFEGTAMFAKAQSRAPSRHQGPYRSFKRFGLSKMPKGHAEMVLEALAGKDPNEVICLS